MWEGGNGALKLGFIDVGGGMRGIYGAGVFDYCMSMNITCDYFIGVSAGAANGASFAAGQMGRNRVFYEDYAFRKAYMGIGNRIRTGSYIGLDYIYSTLSNDAGEYPLNYEALKENPMEFEIVATNALTGEPVFFTKEDLSQNHYDPIKASCCIPVLCKPYSVKGIPCFDGGISDPIPFDRAFEAGCAKVIVVLTKPKDSHRTDEAAKRLAALLRHRYPRTARALEQRSEVYNRSLNELLELERQGKARIIAPSDVGKMKTLTKDRQMMETMYRMGRMDAENLWKDEAPGHKEVER